MLRTVKKQQLDLARIARALRAERRGKVTAKGGYFGAAALLADVEARFRAPAGDGRATDPHLKLGAGSQPDEQARVPNSAGARSEVGRNRTRRRNRR